MGTDKVTVRSVLDSLPPPGPSLKQVLGGLTPATKTPTAEKVVEPDKPALRRRRVPVSPQ